MSLVPRTILPCDDTSSILIVAGMCLDKQPRVVIECLVWALPGLSMGSHYKEMASSSWQLWLAFSALLQGCDIIAKKLIMMFHLKAGKQGDRDLLP